MLEKNLAGLRKSQQPVRGLKFKKKAQREGFEPPLPSGEPDFKNMEYT